MPLASGLDSRDNDMPRFLLLSALLLGGFPFCTDASSVLQSPAPSQLAFSATELDAHSEQTWRTRLSEEARAKSLGCRRYCERIARIFARLATAASRIADAPSIHWQLAIGTSAREGAWALSGGRVYVSEALIDKYELTDDELAFVLGHEMGHALLQHENEALTVAAAFVPRAVSQSVSSMYAELDFDLGLVLKLQPELQAEEFEADHAGMLLGGAAGFDPDGMLHFLEALALDSNSTSPLISTHPQAAERYQRAIAVRYSAQVLRNSSTHGVTN